MKVALTVWENRISPVADSAQQLMIVSLEKGSVGHRRFECFDAENLFVKTGKLVEMGIEVFICGAISSFLASLVHGYGIRLIPFIRGDVDEVLNACIAGCLGSYIMSGCRPDFKAIGAIRAGAAVRKRRRHRAGKSAESSPTDPKT